MVVVKLQGGLGNQLFQYAFGRHLSVKNNVPIKLNISFYKEYTQRSYNLHAFNIRAGVISAFQEIFYNKDSETCNTLYVKVRDALHHVTFVKERQFHFDKAMLNSGKNVILEGYWQTEKYFTPIREIILKEFTVKNELDGKDKEIVGMINKTNAVSMHIRRADYVEDANTNNILGTCSIDYYKKAADIIAKKDSNPTFFVFSDDHEWARGNIRLNYPVIYVDHNNADKNFEDLRLMSLCKHNVIANSSFSWWGAWLNNSAGKIVIAPSKWFNNFDADTKDLYPENWIKI